MSVPFGTFHRTFEDNFVIMEINNKLVELSLRMKLSVADVIVSKGSWGFTFDLFVAEVQFHFKIGHSIGTVVSYSIMLSMACFART